MPEPALSAEEQAAFAAGIAQFNDALFYECHDTLEDVWSGVRGPSRDFFQGLVQLAVAFYHLGNGNRAGALTLLGRALVRLDRYPDAYAGVALAQLRAAAGEWRDALASGGEAPLAPPRIEARVGAG